jgi:glutamate-1-semialdehyde 2,1-aminomutase
VLRNVLSTPEMVGRRDPHSRGMLTAAIDATLVCRYNDLDDVEAAFAGHPEQIAAVILEPIGHNAPGILPEPGFLEGLRRLCDREGALLIFDEVITGFRHALGGYQSICGVTPDLTTLGKAIANGFPLAAVAGRREYMERYTTNPAGDVHFGGTFNGGSVAVAAGLATIEHLERHPVHEHIYALGERMRVGLRAIADEAGIEAYVGGFGSLFVLCFMEGPLRSYEDVLRNDNARFLRYRRALVNGGVFEMPESLGRSHISAAHTVEDIDRSLDVARDGLRAALT